MKRLLLIFALVLACSPSTWASINLIGYSGASSQDAGDTVTLPNSGSTVTPKCTTSSCNTTGATLIVLSVAWFKNAAIPACSSITDSASNTYIAGTSFTTALWAQQFFYKTSPTTSTTHSWVCHNTMGTGVFPSMTVSFFSGTAAFDQIVGASSGSTIASIQTGSTTPNHADELIIGGCSANATTGTLSFDSGFIALASLPNVPSAAIQNSMAYITQRDATTVNPTCTNGGGAAAGGMSAALIAFQAGAAAKGMGELMLIGVGK